MKILTFLFILLSISSCSYSKTQIKNNNNTNLTSAIMFVIDKSGSMRIDKRINAVRSATLEAINALSYEDYVGVVAFDYAPLILMKIDKVEKVNNIAEKRLNQLSANGGTNLLPALIIARKQLEHLKVARKHIVILTDGIFPYNTNQFQEEITVIKSNGITISSIALGNEVDINVIRYIAKHGGGVFYHIIDPSKLSDIFIADVKEFTGNDVLIK